MWRPDKVDVMPIRRRRRTVPYNKLKIEGGGAGGRGGDEVVGQGMNVGGYGVRYAVCCVF